MVIKMKVVYKLYEYRTERKMSLRELEELSGISKATINRIENQQYNPTVLTICVLADALNVSPYDLFYVEKIDKKQGN